MVESLYDYAEDKCEFEIHLGLMYSVLQASGSDAFVCVISDCFSYLGNGGIKLIPWDSNQKDTTPPVTAAQHKQILQREVNELKGHSNSAMLLHLA